MKMNPHGNTPQFPAYFKQLLLLILGIPMLISFVFTMMQWYPATYVIDRLADERGEFSFKLAVAINWFLPVLLIAVLAGTFLRILKKR